MRDLAQAQLDGLASDADLELLEQHRDDWVTALGHLRRDVGSTLQRLDRELSGAERELVLSDFREELERIDAKLAELTGESPAAAPDRGEHDAPRPEEPHTTVPHRDLAVLQLSWHRGRVVAWAANERADAEGEDRVLARLGDAGVMTDAWESHEPVRLPGDGRAPTVAAEAQAALGWLVSVTAEQPVPSDGGEPATTDGDTGAGRDPHGPAPTVGPSVRWMGRAAALAVHLVAQGRMVPQLVKVGDAPGNRSYFAVRWEPTLIDRDELNVLAKAMPGAVAALDPHRDPRQMTQRVVTGFVDAICRDAASRLEVPAAPPQPQRASEVAEAALARLDGSTFEAPHQQGTDIRKGLRSWAEAVTGTSRLTLAVQLDPPDDDGAWLLQTLTSDGRRRDEPVEAAMSRANHERKEGLKRELERLEQLYEPLARSRDTRRGQVILDQEEAWELMTRRGQVLTAAGFEVRVPELSTRKARPSLRITSVGAQETAVGAQQLNDVRWSAVFDDVELTAQDIERLADESRPLVRSNGRWVEVDHADLEAAAAALAERADQTRLTGADMLRFALGLEDTALGRTIGVAGDGWAADLLRSAANIPTAPPSRPEGFDGELRTYQAEALAWLEFLDEAGLGGCLALDMGLGKTPTILAQLVAGNDTPSLVVAPPAVVGNWAEEAASFTPGLRVAIHHGADRAAAEDLAEEVSDVDVLITTYGTAVRDIEALARIGWDKLVLDEAQVIKNPTSETALQLRRLDAHSRVVLTGTPIENGLGDLWALMDFVNPGLVGDRAGFVSKMQQAKQRTGGGAESALRTLNGVLVFRRTKAEPVIAAELPDRIDTLDRCPMTPEQIGLYQAVLDELVAETTDAEDQRRRKGAVLAAITALKQICNHPAAYTGDEEPLEGRSGKLTRLEEIVDNVFESGERMLVFTHFATWGTRLAEHLSRRTGVPIASYHGGLARGARDRIIREFQEGTGPGALVLSLKAGGTGLNLTAASHVVLYDRWWNPAVEDQARDRAWRIGQTHTVMAHRLVCPGTVDERVEEVVAGKRRIADLALPQQSSIADLDSDQLRRALGIDPTTLLADENGRPRGTEEHE